VDRLIPVDVARRLYEALRDDAEARPDPDNPMELPALDIVLYELEMVS
jgi:hypothetical protein